MVKQLREVLDTAPNPKQMNDGQPILPQDDLSPASGSGDFDALLK